MDRRANAFLVQRFSGAYPNDSIVAEESLPTDSALAEQVSAERVWFIDPLDGTNQERGVRQGATGMVATATKNHCALYMFSNTTLRAFVDDLVGFDLSKGTVRFQPQRPLPAALVKRLVAARLAECGLKPRSK